MDLRAEAGLFSALTVCRVTAWEEVRVKGKFCKLWENLPEEGEEERWTTISRW